MGKRVLLLGTAVAAATILGSTAGYFARIEATQVRSLETLDSPQMTRVLDRNGAQVASFASEKRIALEYHQIPQSFRDALIASEDAGFFHHAGFDVRGAVRAVLSDLRQRRLAEGASTITMQLAGMLLLDRSKRTVRRKLQEIVLATQIERTYSKQEILRLYCNHVHMGHGLHGLGAASRYYFGKPASKLTIGESATLVGLLPRPASYSPLQDPELALGRRSHVLRRMVVAGYLSADDARRIGDEPIVVATRSNDGRTGSYFVEEVRRWIGETYDSSRVHAGGLEVRTSLDRELQQFAELAVAEGLSAFDARRAGSGPAAQAALVALDPASGEILAMVGGRDFASSEFNRATQARRQAGSAFKPFVYATALASGFTLADTLRDEPTVFVDPRNPVPYQPENFSLDYAGTITLRAAVEESVNIATVRLLDQVGYEPVIETARRLGLSGRLLPYPSLALGAFEVTLLEMTGAYGALANGGVHVEPHAVREVRDGAGRSLYRSAPAVRDAVSPQVAFLMNHLLSGVIRSGTGRTASDLGGVLAGKTGTTNDFTDAWFIGYSPELVAGVWVGFDVPRSLGPGETGARAALPIWRAFFEAALEDAPDSRFDVPEGISFVYIDRHTGLKASHGAGCRDGLSEAFLTGTEPLARCGAARHDVLALPYPFQSFPLDARGFLQIPHERLQELLASEGDVELDLSGTALVGYGPEGTVRVELSQVEGAADPEQPASTERLAEPRLGKDGRRAHVVEIGRSGKR